MGTRQVSNTLSRWHKVVDRFKQSIAQLSGDIKRSISPVTYNNLAVVKVEREHYTKVAADAVAKVDLLLKLNATVGHIREQLARANVEKGVSALLAEQVSKQAEKALLEDLVSSTEGVRLNFKDAEVVMARNETANSAYREHFTFSRVDESVADAWRSELDALNRALVALSDRISDANAQRVAIELDEDVLAYMGM
ncbi:trigger factor [Novimethylophilus kurashikiensis]|uniref:Trigger factor n=1 Tax=Novimethylophilus kurashikiensis TaxID=1825523 RepID=A0A2R5FD24_9PROT|nr:hypothetical protein [Novimethylophilus kurashikiensis]GBG14591.1 trigger factor [Novimethylophilus kurashikiensis]